MRAILRREYERFFTGKILFLIFGCFLFSFSERQVTNLSYLEFMLHTLAEHYYITYFMIPVYLLVVYKSLDDEIDYVLIRSRYYWKYFWTKVLASTVNIIGFVLIQLVVIGLVGMGLSMEQSFIHSSTEVIEVYAKHFQNPVTAIMMASGYMVLGLTIMSTLFFVVHHFFSKKSVSIVMISLYVLMTFGLKVPGLNEVPFLFMNNYILLYYNFSSNNQLVISFISMLIILVITMILVTVYWKRQPPFRFELRMKGITFYYARYLFTKKNVLILVAIVSFVSVWKVLNLTSFQEATANDFFISLFYGHGVDEFYMIGFLEMLILNGVPLYLFAIFMEKIHREESLGLVIRLKSKRNWTRTIIWIAILFIFLYIGLMIGIGLVCIFVQDLPMDGAIILIAKASILKSLDILFQTLLFIMLFIWKRNVTFAFLLVLSTNALSLLPMSWVIYLPIGLSSLSRNSLVVGDQGLSYILSFMILTIFVLMQWIYIKYRGYKKVLGG